MKKQTKDNKGNEKQVKQMDARFKKSTYDPKFITPSSKVSKVKIDERFSKMMTDPRFAIGGSIDKYGRSKKKSKVNEQLKDYYYLDKDIEEEQIQREQQNDIEENQQPNQQQFIKKPNSIKQWMDQYQEESSEESQDIHQELVEEDDYEVWSQEKDIIQNQKVPITKRLALCNYDWMNISAGDLMLLFNSFKPKQGIIQSVQVYQSDYGKVKMEEQSLRGPQILLEQSAIEKSKQKKSNKYQKNEQEGNSINPQKLRAYQKDRLKYFYAIILCDSKNTAQQIYEKCDRQQFQNSNLSIDLRFVPDDLVLKKQMLKEQVNDVPTSGQVKQSVGKAIGNSNVQLTWQDPQLSLAAGLKRKNWNKMSDEQFQKIDWRMYINQDQIQQDQTLKKTAKTVELERSDYDTDWRKQCNKKKQKSSDIEITFGSGFDSVKPIKKQGESKSINQQKQSLKQKRRQKEQKQRQQLQLLVEGRQKEDFVANVSDERFKAVYVNPLYSIDPVDPKFDHRKTGNVFKQVVKRNRNKNNE